MAITRVFFLVIYISCFLACKFSKKKSSLGEIGQYVSANYFSNEVLEKNDTLIIVLEISENDGLALQRMLITHYCMIYDLKDKFEDVKVLRIINQSPETGEEFFDYHQSGILEIVELYGKNPIKYDFHKYLLKNIDVNLFTKIEMILQRIKLAEDERTLKKSMLIRLINKIAEKCDDVESLEDLKKSLKALKKLGGTVDGNNKAFIKKEKLDYLDFYLNYCP